MKPDGMPMRVWNELLAAGFTSEEVEVMWTIISSGATIIHHDGTGEEWWEGEFSVSKPSSGGYNTSLKYNTEPTIIEGGKKKKGGKKKTKDEKKDSINTSEMILDESKRIKKDANAERRRQIIESQKNRKTTSPESNTNETEMNRPPIKRKRGGQW